ncbi:MAG: hypothetical protein HN341_11485 [Verrucomicrobia bacterium]|jgi:uroporphyrinogen decarboxylase|nr:hypothetical protein [Verrucomicrobiota bacterium]
MTISHGWNGPVKAEPDFEQLLKVLRREAPDRPTLFEFFHNGPLYNVLAAGGDAAPGSPEQTVIAFRNAGYDYATILPSDYHFPGGEHHNEQTISLNEGNVITDRASFEAYEWPDPATASFAPLERAAAVLPEGMKIISQGPGGVLENIIGLVGFDNLCFLLADDPELTKAIFDAVGARLVAFYRAFVQHDAVGAIIGNDDWGFKTQPMISPDDMRRYVVPWHKRIAQVAHDAGKPAVMHSCGNLAVLMDDIIDDIGYDGKHSYEDAIMPIEEAYETYSDRIALLGGLDVDFVIRSTPDEVYRRAKAMLERSADRGAYALGTGNSVPEYIPDEHFFAMIKAAVEER